MPASHRKFGDLLEEGIKRVHITRKKPIGYILDEFGYELRPDDSSKGRYSLGHWYYKKRIPASMDDVAKLAELVVANSDVDHTWLNAFLASAGYSEPEKLSNKLLPVKSDNASTPVFSNFEQTERQSDSFQETPVVRGKYLWNWPVFVIPVLIIAIAGGLFWMQLRKATSSINLISTATQSLQPLTSALTATQKNTTTTPVEQSITASATSASESASFDGVCPSPSSAPVFEYSSPQSFRDFLNHGGSFVALQSEFNTLVQQKLDIQDGRISNTDLTGDGVPEVIISAISENNGVWQILGCDQGQYEALVDNNDSHGRYLRFTVDLNSNKLPEIISYSQTQSGPDQLFEFFIQEWNGHQVVDLLDYSRFEEVGQRLPADITAWQKSIANATITTRDTNDDGFYEMIVTSNSPALAPTCETRFARKFEEVWAWNGKSFQLTQRVYDLPMYRFQRSADGDLAFALKQYDLALDAYQDVVFDANLLRRDQYPADLEYCRGIDLTVDNSRFDNEQEQLTAYARWRILLLNSFNGSEDAMRVVYQTLKERFPEGNAGYSYTVIATAFWGEYQTSQNIQAACAAANSAASALNLHPSHTAANICFIP